MIKFLGRNFPNYCHSGRSGAESRAQSEAFGAIQTAAETLWIALKSFTSCPAFAGMTEKNPDHRIP
jgi:hypothetical protein